MQETRQYRLTKQVPLVRVKAFCRSLEAALAERYAEADREVVWRRYVSAECPQCGIPVCGEELRALAFPPRAELASAKTGRMRLGDCARRGCNAWHYDVHFWMQEKIDWPAVFEAAEKPAVTEAAPALSVAPGWLLGLQKLAIQYGPRVGMVACLFVGLWLARQLYQGGRIPFFREPERFTIHEPAAVPDPAWPKPMDGSDKQF